MRAKLLILLTLLISATALSQFNSPNSINWRTFARGALSKTTSETAMVLETQGSYEQWWLKNVGAHEPIPKGVDWNREKLIAITLGQRPNPGHELFVKSILRARSNEIVVTYVEQLPFRGAMYPQMVITPYVLVKMDRTSGVIHFKREVEDPSKGSGVTIITPPNNNKGSCCGPVCKCCESCGCGCKRG